ncbi:tRNA wybutosine-synthesizing protein 2/3/4 isoform X1 [Ricinus communis]|uniref:tRNA wybutosine-synthesizing protein 2/3/4 isoform X1 n=1 Tax=Ricinus communis TaxID=3988 RepID=UPI000772C010|nr:tRNA wybutosine-synthesizing protein 2/3/4 isoform X1 [Ricinus communis]|eukprot:XP_015574248.1 tRNA wybutosine-synthesizing protein 2/3/4 isoform X1 [Ricinus communis]
MEFLKRKEATLSSLKTDKSPKGTIDTPIIPLLNSLNSHHSYFTTSSCSGRISILAQPKPIPTHLTPNKKKARGGSWLFISHDPAKSDSVLSLLFPCKSVTESSDLVFRFEPLIIAVECLDIESAQFLVSLAISSGFRESGITSANKKRVIVGIRCSIRMEVPLGDTDDVLVSPEYVRFLVEIANEKMEANRNRTQGFLSALVENGFVGPTRSFSENGDLDNDGDDDIQDEDLVLERANGGAQTVFESLTGRVGVSGFTLSNGQMVISGEPLEKLFLWGHSACVLDNNKSKNILVFGGFGGMGRHARRNDTLLLDPINGTLKTIDAVGAPSPRLGHTASLVGDLLFVIGGRSGPLDILGDVWILNTASKEWRLAECTGSYFSPRHRHAAAVVGSSIYVYGGLDNETSSSSLYVLNTESLQWKEVLVGGEQPCARHSHSMVAYGSKLFMFGGYNGEKALGDLYSFDIQTHMWKKENTSGGSPHPRFSHSLFVYNHFLGLIGGCPVRQNSQELSLLNLQNCKWNHVAIDYIGKELLVRSTANVVGDELVMIGGGAACYAFGTKFSEPLKISLLPLMSLEDKTMPLQFGEKHGTDQYNGVSGENNDNIRGSQVGNAEPATYNYSFNLQAEQSQLATSHWILQLEKKYAKLGKDMLKKFHWLDLTRKVHSQKDGLHVCFPITEKFYEVFSKRQHKCGDVAEGQNKNRGEMVLLNEVSCSTTLNLLKHYGATLLADEIVEARRTSKSPLQLMKEAVASLIKHKGLSTELLEQLPTRWERLGNIVVLPVTSFKDPSWDLIGEELWPAIARSLNSQRLARNGRVAPTGTRDSTLEMLVGDNGWVDHRENGILYSFDVTKCMFSWGNLSEKIRMAHLDCKDEVIVDLFAGIGYFVLPFLVRANAKLVYACEWNPHAVEALKRNLEANSVSDQCVVLEGDNRLIAPRGVADRVCLGLLPSSEGSWVTAVRALRSEGGVLHVHGNVKDSEEGSWTEHVMRSIDEIARSEAGHCWEVSIEHVERVKWYAPHIRHLVADVRCRQILKDNS